MCKSIFPVLLLLFCFCSNLKQSATTTTRCEVLVIGGGCSGVAAGIQSARSGAKTIACEETPWLGGMMSAAGVSATDGNHRLPSGLWKSFRDGLYAHYGSPAALNTGWVSNTQFEPHVADSILKALARRETRLEVRHGYVFQKTLKKGTVVEGAVFKDSTGRMVIIRAAVTVDATELGDAFADAGAAFDLGVDARTACGETYAPVQGSNFVQDLTWAAILKDYGPGTDYTIPPSASYRAADFDCCCATRCTTSEKVHPCETMMSYARLPRGKIMINWPLHGNDSYLNVVDMTPEAREAAYQKAREHTLDFIHYMQTELGYKNLGLADDEFPTPNRLPFIPYHREGRRVKGMVRLNVHHILTPYEQSEALYRTGVSVGDYPLDHHHAKAPEMPLEEFPPIPSFNVPLGALIPETIEGLVVAEKGISVTHLVNGSTRLQPCVLLTGQAAGVLAAVAARSKKMPRQISIRAVQEQLLNQGAFLMPYLDVAPDDPCWKSAQRMGATGLMRGKGVPHEWANETWFYPDSAVLNTDLLIGFQTWQPGFYADKRLTPQPLLSGDAVAMLHDLLQNEPERPDNNLAAAWLPKKANFESQLKAEWKRMTGQPFDAQKPVLRRHLAQILDEILLPFEREVDWNGQYKHAP